MSEPRRHTPRLALGLALVLVGLVDVHALLQSLRTQERLRERATRGARQSLAVATAPVRATLPQGPRRAAELARRLTGALSAELFSDSGTRLAASPDGAPVTHRPTPEDLRRLLGGDLVSVGPLAGDPPRLLTYVTLRDTAGTRFLLRISTTAPELVEDMRERRMLWLGHGVSLALLLVAAVLALFPGRDRSAGAHGGVLAAYEEAMGRLREHGAAVDREHQRERRRMEDEIQLKEAMARAGELAAGMAHEVRNGLSTIVGYARLAERSAGTDASHQAVAAILEECATLEATVRRLIDYVKGEKLELQPFDPLRMLSRVAGRESREETEMVAPSAGGGAIVGDEELLERAFENLVRNAREAAGAGGHVWIRGERRGACYHVFVADDGPGLPKEGKDGLRPFHSTKPGGLGLGLPMALKIVRLHQGELLLRDRVPRGLEVEVRLPADGPTAESGVTVGSARGAPGAGSRPEPDS